MFAAIKLVAAQHISTSTERVGGSVHGTILLLFLSNLDVFILEQFQFFFCQLDFDVL